MPPFPPLSSLSNGFRSSYLDYAALTQIVQGWAAAYPSLVRLERLGITPEQRAQWLLVIGPEPERTRPAVWVDANMHAGELAGSNVALALAEDMLRLHLEGSVHDLPGTIAERLREVLFYVLPRLSPDGAERVLTSGRFVRSVPRDERADRGRPHWVSQDVDGDGLSLVMRVRDPGGEFVECAELPGLLQQRQIDDAGPFYKLYPEGFIEHFDGHTIPAPFFLEDNPIDLNRNFPWSWTPAHEQVGAGPFPASEPEARAIVEFATRHPEIFAWLNLHTFGGVLIRPLGHAPDSKMDPSDLALFRQIEEWTLEYTKYPSVSGYEEFLYEPDKPLHGDLSEYAYHQRGAIGYVIELWDLFARLGMPRPKRFVEYYDRFGRADLLRLAHWDREHNASRVFRPWRRWQHPQVGEVEVGGIDPRIGVWNPPPNELPELCRQQAQAFLRVAALAPALRVERPEVLALADGLFRVTLQVENHGYLPSSILASAKKLDFNEPVYVACETVGGCELLDPAQRHVVVGHLEGWGRGLHNGQNLASYQRSSGNGHRAQVVYLVRGAGELRLRVGSCRVGFRQETVHVGSPRS
jgi:Zinc carboxypeptidase